MTIVIRDLVVSVLSSAVITLCLVVIAVRSVKGTMNDDDQ